MAAKPLPLNLFLLFFSFLGYCLFLQSTQCLATRDFLPLHGTATDSSPLQTQLHLQDINSGRSTTLIGSTAPICTYNECRGCKFRCRAEQIPVDANDPINSAYHYRCVCHK